MSTRASELLDPDSDPSAPGDTPRRGRNYARNVYHVLSAAVVVVLVETVLTTPALRIGVGAAGFCAAWGMEISRRLFPAVNVVLMRLFAPVAHAHEATQVNSATWYTTAILLLALLSPVPAGVAGLAVLGVGDPLAALVGRRFGRKRLANGRSVEGAVAFFVGGTAAAALVLLVWHDDAGPVAPMALAAAGGGALAELFVRRLDDNLVIPLVSAGAASVAQWLSA